MNEKQKQITYTQRKKQTREHQLIRKKHWAYKIKDAYNGVTYLQESGREYKGSDPLFKNLESKSLKDKNVPYTTAQTIETSYIYIISKTIHNKTFYKIGIGGMGMGAEGAGRLGNAQVFLIPGLRESVGFKVHYLFFYDKNARHVERDMAMTMHVEQQIHKNLQHEFASANITFPTMRTSEWYLVKATEETFFIGFVVDIIASQYTHPHESWKLHAPVAGKEGKDTFELPKDWSVRMKHNPEYMKHLEDKRHPEKVPVGAHIIRVEFTNDKGKVDDYKDTLLPKGEPKQYTYKGISMKLVDFEKNMRALGDTQLVERNEIYAVVEIESVSKARVLKVWKENDITPYKHPETRSIRYSIHIGDWLAMMKEETYNTEDLLDTWDLKDNYLYYHAADKPVLEVTTDSVTRVPAWYYNQDAQLKYARMMKDEPAYQYHDDFKDDSRDAKARWKVVAYESDRQNNIDVQRVQVETVDGQEVELPDTQENVSVVHVMTLLDIVIGRTQTTKRKRKEVETSIPSVTLVNTKTKKKTVVKKGEFVEIKDNYFTYYKEDGSTDDKSKYTGTTKYIVTKVYKKEHHSENLNPWFDIQVYPRVNNLRWEIFASDPHLPAKLKVLSKATKTPKSTATDHLAKANVDHEPRFKALNVIRMIPDEDKTHTFGEESTPRDVYHYAKILKAAEGVYTVSYFPPYNTEDRWEVYRAQGARKTRKKRVYYQFFVMEDLEGNHVQLVAEKDKEGQFEANMEEPFRTYLEELKARAKLDGRQNVQKIQKVQSSKSVPRRMQTRSMTREKSRSQTRSQTRKKKTPSR